MSGEKTGPDGFTSAERQQFLNAQQAVQQLNQSLENRGVDQQFQVRSSEDQKNGGR